MNAPQRRLFRQNILLGIALTLVAIGLDRTNGLHRLEGWFYDRRVSRCQYFTPAPTDKLVHLDIDDAATDSIGAWPWPRPLMAALIEELHQEGAATLAMDVLYKDPPSRYPVAVKSPGGPEGGTGSGDDPEDAPLAAAIKNFGSVVLAGSFTLGKEQPPTEAHRAVVDLLVANLELSPEAVDAAMRAKGYPAVSPDEYTSALVDAARSRVMSEPGGLSQPAGQLEAKLLPTLSGYATSVQSRIVDRELNRARSLARIDKMLTLRPAAAPQVYHALAEEPPLPCLIEAASGIGFVDILPGADDGVVRYVPLWIEDRGKLVPQLGLAFACAFLHADLKRTQFLDDELRIPTASGKDLVIPMWSDVAGTGQQLGAFCDVPFFGKYGGWETMYDFPNHLQKAKHIPMSEIWNIVKSRDLIRSNNLEIEKGLTALLGDNDDDLFAKYKAEAIRPDDTAAHLRWIDTVLTSDDSVVKGYMDTYDTPAKRAASKQHEKLDEIAALCGQLKAAKRQNQSLEAELSTERARIQKEVSGKGVLIGFAATGQTDFHATSLDPNCPGVVVHGAIFSALVNGFMWTRLPKWETTIATVIIGLLTTAIVVSIPARGAFVGTGLLVLCYLLINGEWFFDYHREILGAAGPVVAGGLVWTGITLIQFIAEVTEHNRIRKRFSSYVDPILVNYVTEHPELERLEGQVREMTVVFTDLAGFTSLAEALREKAVGVLSRYTDRMVPVIQRNHGLVNKFMGDGIMFSFGAPYENPHHAADAVNTVLELHAELATLNDELVKEGFPKLGMRAGVGTGEVVVGDTGGVQRCDYTCIGDVTNFASRLEAANKSFGTKSLLSARTVELLNGQFLVRPIGRVQVVGKKQGVMSFEPICRMDEATAEQKRDLEMTALMVEYYAAGKFAQCLAVVERMHHQFPSKLVDLYGELARRAMSMPSESFNGNIVLDHK